MNETSGRTNFRARVASNSLDIAIREQQIKPQLAAAADKRIRAMFNSDDSSAELRWALTRGLRDQTIALGAPGLEEYLRFTVVNQAAIDQPGYSGFKTAVS